MTALTQHLRQSFARFPSGIVAVCGQAPDGNPVGMAVSTFIPVSLDPPLVGICLQNTSRTWRVLRELPRLGVSILAAEHKRTARALAAKDGDRFADVDHHTSDGGAVVVADASGWFECTPEREIGAGDHVVALLRVHQFGMSEAPPLVFHRSGLSQLHGPGRLTDGLPTDAAGARRGV